jgi:hypothetical protein
MMDEEIIRPRKSRRASSRGGWHPQSPGPHPNAGVFGVAAFLREDLNFIKVRMWLERI